MSNFDNHKENATNAKNFGVVIGQECICPDGLGRVNGVDRFGLISVTTYVNNRGCTWAKENVKLVPLPAQLVTAEELTELRESAEVANGMAAGIGLFAAAAGMKVDNSISTPRDWFKLCEDSLKKLTGRSLP